MHIITDSVRKLMEGDIEPGFAVGAGLWLYGSDPGFGLMRQDGTIVLTWPGQTGMIRVTTGDLRQQEKAAITRVVRGARPHFTPDWQLWHAMRNRSRGEHTFLPLKQFV